MQGEALQILVSGLWPDFEDIKIVYKIYSLQKKRFQKIIEFSFSTLDHDLYVSDACCNYVLCSLDPGESIGNNYSIIGAPKIF